MNSHFIKRSKCPCCESPKSLPLHRSPYIDSPLRDYLVSFYSAQGTIDLEYLNDQDYVLVECPECGTIYQQEIPGDFLMYKLYEEWIDPHTVFELVEKRRTTDYYLGLISEVVSVMNQFDRPPMQLQMLDFGMGWGHWCRSAQAFGCTVYGTELSSARIDYTRQTGVRIITNEEISKLKFDFINAEQVFEHLPNPRETLTQLSQSLKEDGMLKISVPDGGDIKQRLKKWDWSAPKDSKKSLNPVAPLEHINCFTQDSLIHLARECGLIPIDVPSVTLQIYSNGLLETIKTILRPYFNRLREVERSNRKFFRLSGG